MRARLLASCLVVLVLLTTAARALASPPDDLDVEDLVAGATVKRDAPRIAPGGHAWVSLVGFRMPLPDGRTDSGGMLVVGFPFDRAARSSARAAYADPPKPPPPPPPKPSPPPDVPLALTPRLARAAVAASWRAAGLGVDDARIDAIVSRARWSGVLPEARVRVIRWDGARLYDDSPADTTPPHDSTTASLGMEARLTWRLDRLLFSEDEPSFERIRIERQDARARIAAKALEALFHWQRALLDLGAAEKGSHDETDAALRVAESEAVLDVLTDGWFTQRKALTGSP